MGDPERNAERKLSPNLYPESPYRRYVLFGTVLQHCLFSPDGKLRPGFHILGYVDSLFVRIIKHIGIFRHILWERPGTALPFKIGPVALKPSVLDTFYRAVHKIIRIIHHMSLRINRRLTGHTIDQHLLGPGAIFRFSGNPKQVIADFEHGPGTAGNLAAAPIIVPAHKASSEIAVDRAFPGRIPGILQHLSQKAFFFGKQALRRPIAAGCIGMPFRNFRITILNGIQIVFLPRHLIGHGRAGKAVYLTVGMTGPYGGILIVELIPQIGIIPFLCKIQVFLLSGKLIGTIQIFRKGVPFDHIIFT